MSEPRDNRVPFMMSATELAAVDKWRFDSHIATRAEALRRLCQIGLMFDERAVELRQAVKDAAEFSIQFNADLTSLLEAAAEKGIDVIDVAISAADLVTAQAKLSVLAATVGGLSNNFRQGQDIEKDIEEATEIKEILSSSLEKLRPIQNKTST